ncbi:MAG: family efflux transporter [Evtepia sp.]|nr:family efflux transporter [Evtepia sp.]
MQQFNLTEGVIWKTLIRYSLPVVLSSFLQSTYSIVDLILAGQFIGKVGISAINNSSQIIVMLTQIIMGITMGGNILIGQYYGGKDRESRVETNITLFTMSLVFGVIGMLLIIGFGKGMLILLGAPALDEASSYLKICAVGLLPVFGYNALSAMIRGVGNSKQPLYFIMVTALCNVVLDVWFMGGLHLGTAGAAWATVISQTLSFLIALSYTLKHKDLFALDLLQLSIKKEKLLHMLRLGIPSAVQMTLVGLSWLTMTFLINRYGVEASAASGIAAKIKDLALLFTIAMSSATSTMVAQCLGAEEFDRASRSVHVARQITVAVSIVLILLIELTAPYLVTLFGPDAQTAHWAVINLRIEIMAQVFYASFMVYNALAIGAGHTLFALASSITNSIIVRLILAVVLNHYLGLIGIFWACMIAPASSVPLGYVYERSNVWRKSLAHKTKETES